MTDENKKKPTAKNKDEGPRVVTLTESQEEMWVYTLKTLVSLGDALEDVGSPMREFALGLTKLQEAEMWIDRGFDMLGIDPHDDEGDEGDEYDGDDEDDGDDGDDGDDE